MATKPPAFQFYASDFLASTMVMTTMEVGAYIRALAHSWDCGALPKDQGKLSRMLQLSAEEFAAVWPTLSERFTETSKGYINRRLEVERKKQALYREKQANKGRASAQQRFNRGSTAVQPEGQPETGSRLQPEGNSPSPSPSPSPDQKEQEGQGPEALAALWNERASTLPACLKLTIKRRRAARARLAERDLGEWGKVVDRIHQSPFCCGQNDRGWVATFDWFLNPENILKVEEGKYDNRKRVSASVVHLPAPQPEYNGDWFEECKAVHGGECGLDKYKHAVKMRSSAVAS